MNLQPCPSKSLYRSTSSNIAAFKILLGNCKSSHYSIPIGSNKEFSCIPRCPHSKEAHFLNSRVRASSCVLFLNPFGPTHYSELELDEDFLQDLTETCNKVRRVCSAGDEPSATVLSKELIELVQFMESQGEAETALFLNVLVKVLAHEDSDERLQLRGPYKDAHTRLLNELDDSKWRIGSNANDRAARRVAVEGRRGDPAPQAAAGPPPGRQGAADPPRGERRDGDGAGAGRGAAGELYATLGVAATATAAEIKSAFRRLALETHPV